MRPVAPDKATARIDPVFDVNRVTRIVDFVVGSIVIDRATFKVDPEFASYVLGLLCLAAQACVELVHHFLRIGIDELPALTRIRRPIGLAGDEGEAGRPLVDVVVNRALRGLQRKPILFLTIDNGRDCSEAFQRFVGHILVIGGRAGLGLSSRIQLGLQ